MHPIQVDDDVFELLQKNAVAFIDSPNSTLRRLLGLEKPVEPEPQRDKDLEQLLADVMSSKRSKAPKADLRVLVQSGLIKEGDPVFLIDYQGRKVPGASASVSNGQLVHRGQRYTMSRLAQDLLGDVGFKSNSIRGPSHWVNTDGKSVTELWKTYTNGITG